jgi:hypothetical protein
VLEAGALTRKVQTEIARNVKKLGEFKAWLDTLGFRRMFTDDRNIELEVQTQLTKWLQRHPDFHVTTASATQDDIAKDAVLESQRDMLCIWAVEACCATYPAFSESVEMHGSRRQMEEPPDQSRSRFLSALPSSLDGATPPWRISRRHAETAPDYCILG